jgi:hypothetical protein
MAHHLLHLQKSTKLIIFMLKNSIHNYSTTTSSCIPCLGGSVKDCCSGYRKGEVHADKDDSNVGNVPAGGQIFSSMCPSGHTPYYCSGWNRGYNDEAGVLHYNKTPRTCIGFITYNIICIL